MTDVAPDEARLIIDSGDGPREVLLSSYLDSSALELAESESNRWIKHLRHLHVDGLPLRDRFTHRGDSLWWFIELYLHKERAIVRAHGAILAMERLMDVERPTSVRIKEAGRIARRIVPHVAARGRVRVMTKRGRTDRDWLRLRAAFYIASASLSARRRRSSARISRAPIVGVVHSAFWRTDTNEEAYIGDVIHELSNRVDSGTPLVLIGVGPRTSLKARGWRQRLREFTHGRSAGVGRFLGSLVTRFRGSLVPGATDNRCAVFPNSGTSEPRNFGTPELRFWRIEDFPTPGRVSPGGIWKQARRDERVLHGSDDLRRAARIRGCDVWSILKHELSGIALLQLPWSRLAMDHAASALDTLEPRVIFTYAEAGGWGRALVLEARRRSIVSVGLQHGFIYRHWLNYLHDADEMHPSRVNAADRGFPRPDLTLVFDRLAERYLRECGRFPAGAIRVTGSARLDAVVSRFNALTGEDRRRLRSAIGAGDDPIILVTSKFSQIQGVLPALVDWVVHHPNLRLVIKAHPAEPPAVYQTVTGAARNTIILPAPADLAAWLAVSALVVTVNSTVALEAMTLDVPALVLGLPNNLSPFVEVGALAGAERADQIGPVLEALLYDEGRRARLATARRAFVEHFGLLSDGRAAARAAETILALSGVGVGGRGSGIGVAEKFPRLADP